MGKTLITGAAGFIGSHLVERCVELGYDVRAFIHYNSKNSWGWLDESPAKKAIEIVKGDIRDYDSVRAAIKECDSVFHLAALVSIPYSYESPLAYIKTNIEGTYNVLEASRELSVSNIVVTSTSETYGTAQTIPIDENHPMVGQSPYSATKIAADQLAISYYRSFDLPIKIVRPFNTYGPRQSARAIVPSIIIQIINGKREIQVGNLYPTRDLTYIMDTVNGFIEIFKSDDLYGEITNVGMNEEISIEDLVNLIAQVISAEIEIFRDPRRIRPEKSEVERLRCDNNKIRTKTKWIPKYTLEQGLEQTIEWLKEHYEMYKAEIYNV